MEQPSASPALEELEPLVGEWSLAASPPDGPAWPGGGRVTFEWLEGRAFLIERWAIEMPEAPDGIAIIGPDDSGKGFRQHYFDSRGVARIYEMSLRDGVWKLWRDGDDFSQRFTANFSDNGNAIEGRWEAAMDGTTWEIDFDLTYTRIS